MRIYLLDDEAIVLITLRDFLSDLGHEVVSANSDRELFDKLSRSLQPVDLIITDLRIPNGDGVALIRKVHRRYPDVDIIVMTGYTSELSSEEAVVYGVYAYLRKPIRLSELELLLARLFESRSARALRSGDNGVER